MSCMKLILDLTTDQLHTVQGCQLSFMMHHRKIKLGVLTDEQEPASVIPAALVKYFPAEQRVQATALEPEN